LRRLTSLTLFAFVVRRGGSAKDFFAQRKRFAAAALAGGPAAVHQFKTGALCFHWEVGHAQSSRFNFPCPVFFHLRRNGIACIAGQ
jgi:hypothetical protein